MVKKAVFGAGCFWGVEDMYRNTPGVVDTTVGYMGGLKENPTYEEVCSHTTGHAEVVQVSYDSDKVAFTELLKKFFNSHNPTIPDNTEMNMGSQYRSVIFYYEDEQRKEAEGMKHALNDTKKWQDPIATKILPAMPFWIAEEYHQQYFSKKGMSSTCHT